MLILLSCLSRSPAWGVDVLTCVSSLSGDFTITELSISATFSDLSTDRLETCSELSDSLIILWLEVSCCLATSLVLLSDITGVFDSDSVFTLLSVLSEFDGTSGDFCVEIDESVQFIPLSASLVLELSWACLLLWGESSMKQNTECASQENKAIGTQLQSN